MTIFYSEAETSVVEYLKRNPGATIATMVAGVPASRSTVRNALVKAIARGNLLAGQEWPRRYTWLDIPLTPVEAVTSYVVAPDVVQPAEFGKRFMSGRPNIVKALSGIDLTKHDRKTTLDTLEAVSKAVLGLYVALSQVDDGPEWRQEAGI